MFLKSIESFLCTSDPSGQVVVVLIIYKQVSALTNLKFKLPIFNYFLNRVNRHAHFLMSHSLRKEKKIILLDNILVVSMVSVILVSHCK